MSIKNLALCGTAFACLSFAGAAQAQDEQTTSVDELLVATRSLEQTVPLELSRQGHDLVIVGEEVIQNKSYPDVAAALQMEVPGLYIASTAGPFSYSYLSLQGSRTQDVLWTIDGIRINNRLYSTTAPSDTLPSSMIERIEVLKGGEGLFYGTQGVAGVINVVTRDFSDTFNGQVTLGGDTNDSLHIDGLVRGSSGPHRFVAFATKDEADGFESFSAYQPSATMRDRGYDVLSGGLKYGIDLSENLSLNASWIRTDADLDYPSPTRVAFSQNSREEDTIGLKLDYAPDEGLQFFIKAYHHDWDSRYTTIVNSLTSPVIQTTTDDNLYWGYKDQGINALAKYPVGGFDLLAGYDFQEYEARDEVLIIDTTAEEVHAFFAQVATNNDLSDRYRIAAGVRYNQTGENTATVWNINGRFDITGSVFVQGNIGSSFTLPTAENLFAIDPFSTFGNPALRPEEGTNFNVSLGGRVNDSLEWMVTGFKRNIKDLITFSDDPALVPDAVEALPDYSGEAYVNLGEAEFTGFEVLGAGKLADNWRWNVSFTSTNAESVGVTPPAGFSPQLDRIPRTFTKAGLSYEAPSGKWGASGTGLWVGDNFRTLGAFNAPAGSGVPSLPREQVNFGDYYVLDLAAHLYLDEDQKHKIVARLQNALDEPYATGIARTAVDPPAIGRFHPENRGVPRTFHLRYTYSFGE